MSHIVFDILKPPPAYVRRLTRPPFVFFDVETWSESNLKTVGTARYVRDPSTELLMLAWAREQEDVQQWVPGEDGSRMPDEVEDFLKDDRIAKVAHNAAFERQVVTHTLNMPTPFNVWRCTMVLMHHLALPPALEKAGIVLGLPIDMRKHAQGKVLVRMFCLPNKPTKTRTWTRRTHITDPQPWEDFKDYNIWDVVSERGLWARTWRWDLPDWLWEEYWLDQKINETGVPVNMDVVRNAVAVIDGATDDRLDKMRAITDLDNPNSNVQLLSWLNQNGYVYQDLKKGHVAKEIANLESDLSARSDDDLYRVLVMRRDIAQTSIKKYEELAVSVDEDGVLRNTTQFLGASRTGRSSGRKYQIHNLAKPPKILSAPELQIKAVQDLEINDWRELDRLYGTCFDPLKASLRPTLQAPDGYVWADADLNAIEPRVLAWMSDDEKMLEIFRENKDPYVDFAVEMFGGTYESQYHTFKVLNDKTWRNLCKPPVLGCGYGLGSGEEWENDITGEIEGSGLLKYARDMDIILTPEQSTRAVTLWREKFVEAVEYWYKMERVCRHTIISKNPRDCWPVRFEMAGPFVRMVLPSGRPLYYARPKIQPRMMPWRKVKNSITYEQLEKNKWKEVPTHGSHLVENADQAISRDLLWLAIVRAQKRGLSPRIHIHDSLACLVPENRADEGLKALVECLTEPPGWDNDQTLMLDAVGTTSKYFVKD